MEGQLGKHYINRANWLRASVLGANDGIISTTSLVIGITAANSERGGIILAAIAGLVSGALSMAAGEYVSVSSQLDIEKSDIERERKGLRANPEMELEELTKIYRKRGLDKDLALEVAVKLTEYNALETHTRDELGINEYTVAKPFQAAFSSFTSFIAGALLPLLVSIFAPLSQMIIYQYVFAAIFLAILGSISAKTGGANIWKGVFRVLFWGTLAMAITALVGYVFGTQTI